MYLFEFPAPFFFPSSPKKGTFKKRQKKREAGDSRYLHLVEFSGKCR